MLDDQIREAREQYTIIAGRNRVELSRMGLEREVDFRCGGEWGEREGGECECRSGFTRQAGGHTI